VGKKVKVFEGWLYECSEYYKCGDLLLFDEPVTMDTVMKYADEREKEIIEKYRDEWEDLCEYYLENLLFDLREQKKVLEKGELICGELKPCNWKGVRKIHKLLRPFKGKKVRIKVEVIADELESLRV